MSAETSPPPEAPPPQAKVAPPTLSARAPRPTAIRIRRRAAIGLALCGACVVAGGLGWAFVAAPALKARSREAAAEVRQDEARGAAKPAEQITGQPASYDRLGKDQLPSPRTAGRAATEASAYPPGSRATPPRTPGPRPSSLSRPPSANRLQAEARGSGLFFASLKSPPQQPFAPGAAPAAASASLSGQDGLHGRHRLAAPLSPYELKAGAIVPATLLTAVDTSRPGPVVASVSEAVFDTVSGRHLLLPQGARLIGRHDGDTRYGDRRAFLTWERLILPNGKSLVLSGEPGVDAQGAVGVRGRADRRLGPLALATLFAGAITTLGEIARDGDQDGGLLGDTGDAAAIEAARVGGRLIDRELQVSPSIRLAPGSRVRVLITRDLILEPYHP